MTTETSYFHLNAANQWPLFELHNIDIDPDGDLVLHQTGGGFAERGTFLAGRFHLDSGKTPWFRLRVFVKALPTNVHVQLFTFPLDDLTTKPPFSANADEPFSGQVGNLSWVAQPRDVLDVLIETEETQSLWIGGILRSDGTATPMLHQMRVDYGRDTYLKYLPEIYSENDSSRDFLERFLSLQESVLAGLEETIVDLPRLFNSETAPESGYPSWLNWLASWLAWDVNDNWTIQEARTYLAHAFELYGKRGTVEGLRRYLKIYAGVEARIEEPSLTSVLWSLGQVSTLGHTTMLAPAHLEGAVLGATATLDESNLVRGNDSGVALFEDVAHRFCVQIYCAELTRPGALADARAVLDREKPAHTVYHLCVIEPRMRVGAQARLGIDSIVGQGPVAQIGVVLDTAAMLAQAEECRKEV